MLASKQLAKKVSIHANVARKARSAGSVYPDTTGFYARHALHHHQRRNQWLWFERSLATMTDQAHGPRKKNKKVKNRNHKNRFSQENQPSWSEVAAYEFEFDLDLQSPIVWHQDGTGYGDVEYKQIPDWLDLQNYIEEIEFLADHLSAGFANKDKVLREISQLEDCILNNPEDFPFVDVDKLVNLGSKLREFCFNNSHDCLTILETVVANGHSFTRFETCLQAKKKKKLSSSSSDDDAMAAGNVVEASWRDRIGQELFPELNLNLGVVRQDYFVPASAFWSYDYPKGFGDLISENEWPVCKKYADSQQEYGLYFVCFYYKELLAFENYLRLATNYRVESLPDLSNEEIEMYMREYEKEKKSSQHIDSSGKVTNSNSNSNSNMAKDLQQYIAKDAHHDWRLAHKEYMSLAKRERDERNYLHEGLHYFQKELREALKRDHLDLNSLSSNLADNVRHAKAVLQNVEVGSARYFKHAIAAARCKELQVRLEALQIPLRILQKSLANRSDLSWVIDQSYKGKSFDWELQAIKRLFHSPQQIPGDINEFAARLYTVCHTSSSATESEEAKQILRTLISDQMRGGLFAHHLKSLRYPWYKFADVDDFDNRTLNILLFLHFPLDAVTDHQSFHRVFSEAINKLKHSGEVADCRALPAEGKSCRFMVLFNSGTGGDHEHDHERQYYIFTNVGDIDRIVQLANDAVIMAAYNSKLKSGTAETGATTLYKQIPEWLHLENHKDEILFLKDQLGGNFDDMSIVMNKVDELMEDITSNDTLYPDLNANSFLKLRSKLKQFCVNNSNDCLKILDSVILSSDVFAEFENKRANNSGKAQAERPVQYKQVPDWLRLENHVADIAFLKKHVENLDDYAKVLAKGDELIEMLINEEKSQGEVHAGSFIKFISRLKEFTIANSPDCLRILDTVVSNVDAFAKFETQMKNKKQLAPPRIPALVPTVESVPLNPRVARAACAAAPAAPPVDRDAETSRFNFNLDPTSIKSAEETGQKSNSNLTPPQIPKLAKVSKEIHHPQAESRGGAIAGTERPVGSSSVHPLNPAKPTKKQSKAQRDANKKTKKEPEKLDLSRLEQYLKDVKSQQESRSREKEAYEWSVDQLKTHNWKVVGSKWENGKRLLILGEDNTPKNTQNGGSRWRFRDIFLIPGLVALGFVGANAYFEREQEHTSVVTHGDGKNEVPRAQGPPPSPSIKHGQENGTTMSTIDSKEEGMANDPRASTWWQKLLWAK
ncbi:uncharacterized protein LODBEIA_P04240 [Lodderomyces beijingensis]|uniref:Uncharacterized protein n=1 Tax=Lodderomyces beijingensis TaxID=1775926 RepID=A0ABP0ZGA4_9ASCO